MLLLWLFNKLCNLKILVYFCFVEEVLPSFNMTVFGENQWDNEKQMAILQATQQELASLSTHVDDLVLNLGKELINEIQAEENFPPDYLKNVIEKVASIKVRFDTSIAKLEKVQVKADFVEQKMHFDRQVSTLTEMLDHCGKWLEEVNEATLRDGKEVEHVELAFENGKCSVQTYLEGHEVVLATRITFGIALKIVNTHNCFCYL